MSGESSILVVEDDPELREAAVHALAERGHEVHATAGGEEALRVVERIGAVDLLFTAIAMPGMDGFALARRVKERRPGIKILYATATADRVEAEIGVVYGTILAKPYRLRDLQVAVETALGAPPPEDSRYWRDKAQQFRDEARRQGGPEGALLENRAREFEAMAEKMEG
jgi:CheY-like chemotaxis protein